MNPQHDRSLADLQKRVGVCTHEADCRAITHFGDCKSMPSSPSLRQLLNEVDALFSKPQKGPNYTYDYSLGRFPNTWSFVVTNSWYKWINEGYQHEFLLHLSPEAAVQAFLAYVKDNKISVADLME